MEKTNPKCKLYQNMIKVINILGITPDKLEKCKKLETTFDIYELMPDTKQREFFDYKKLEYYECDIENHLEQNYQKEYEEDNIITKADVKKMATLLLYDFDANTDFNTLVGNIVKNYLSENNII